MLQMGRSIRESVVVCQGKTWRRMLRTGDRGGRGLPRLVWSAVNAKEINPRDLLRDGVLSEKRQGTPSGWHLDFYFLDSWQEVHRVYGVHIKPIIGPSRGGQAPGTCESPAPLPAIFSNFHAPPKSIFFPARHMILKKLKNSQKNFPKPNG